MAERLVSLKVPDKSGKIGDVVLGYDSIADYESTQVLFWRVDRPLRQPDRERKVFAWGVKNMFSQ